MSYEVTGHDFNQHRSGDSYSQTGFNVNGAKPSEANPIGNPELPGWTAAGGFNWVGLAVTEFNADLLLSYNFAYGGATTDADLVTPYAPEVLSFADQVDLFSDNLAAEPQPEPWTAENSLFAIWIGVNDVGNVFWDADAQGRVEGVVERYFELVSALYDGGARQFAFLTVPRTFLPSYFRTGNSSTDNTCIVQLRTRRH